MSSQYSGGEASPNPDPNVNGRQASSEFWGPWRLVDEDTQPYSSVRSSPAVPGESQDQFKYPPVDPQFTHREHVTHPLPYPSEAGYMPQFRPVSPSYPQQGPGYTQQSAVHPSYPNYPGYSGYQNPPLAYVPYVGYPGYAPYSSQPAQPKRDSFLYGIAIASLIGSILIFLGGCASLFFLALFSVIPHQTLSDSEYFAALMFLISIAAAGILGGIFGGYQSIRSLLQKPSARFALPAFWIFVLLYLIVVAIGLSLSSAGKAVAFLPLTIVLIVLAGLFPALAVLALGDRRLRLPHFPKWPTTWRRFALAIVSGATLGIFLAGLLEFLVEVLLVGRSGINFYLCIDQPNAPSCQSTGVYDLILLSIAVMAPIIEETVKPLAVGLLMIRIGRASEAFVLGLAAGIGFDLIETTSYISSGYHDWLSVALIRTGSGLLHGFGAAMVALGWYYLIHGKKQRLLKAFGCWFYAVLQHALWNGSWGLVLLPAPVGPLINSWNVNIGSYALPFYEIVNIIEALLILAFFIYMTGKVRNMQPSGEEEQSVPQPVSEPQAVRT